MSTQVGVIISRIGSKGFSQLTPPSSSEVMVQLTKDANLSKGSYIVIRDARFSDKKYFGYVSEVMNFSEVLSSGDYYKKILEKGIEPKRFIENVYDDVYMFAMFAKVTLMYEVENGIKKRSETAPTDGSLVYKASPQDVAFFLELVPSLKNREVYLGNLYSDENVRFTPDANKLLTGHVCVFGQTGSGKSYAVGVIIEELVEKGVPVVVFDHMGDYILMDKGVDGGKGLDVIRVIPGKDLMIDPEDLLKAESILLSFGITEAQINLFRDAMNHARTLGYKGMKAINWLLDYVRIKSGGKTHRLVTNLYAIGRQYGYSSATIDGLRWKINVLRDMGILGSGYDIRKIVQRGKLTVVDLRHVKEIALRTLVVADLLRKLMEARSNNDIPPTLVVIEEAHNYAPYEETPSSVMIRDLIRGARHEGISVIIVTQRPAGLHSDVINIANTHIVFRLKGRDLEYVANFLPLPREEIKEIETLPQGVAYVSGPCIPGGLTLKVKFRKRKTIHGGESIEIVM